eukprot:646123-Pyramimonas_sp.AAC.1
MAATVPPPGGVLRWAWVLYRGERLWHQRRVWGRLASPAAGSSDPMDLLISSADHDVYEERYGQGNPDIVAVVFSPTRQALQ